MGVILYGRQKCMLTNDRKLVKSGKIREYLDLDSIYGLITREHRFHMQRVTTYCEILVQYIERDISFINSIERDFYLHSKDVFKHHDIGYAFVPLELFGEDEDIPEHVNFAKEAFERTIYKELDDVTYKHAMECAVYHHERYDGKGYLKGLKGEEIPFVARICAIADMYDHLVTENPYYLKDGNEAIVKQIISESGKRFQPELVDDCQGLDKYLQCIAKSYKEWYLTQYEKYPLNMKNTCTELINVPELFNRRSPGGTCLTAIQAGANGTMETPLNNSKGCGGVMRVAPIGLFLQQDEYKIEQIDTLGAKAAALTHGHELGYIPAAALVHIINLVSHNDDITLLEAVTNMKKTIKKQFANAKHLEEQIKLIDRAISLSKEDVEDLYAINELGEGWVAEETIAIAIYCSLKYDDNFEKELLHR